MSIHRVCGNWREEKRILKKNKKQNKNKLKNRQLRVRKERERVSKGGVLVL